MLKNKIIIIMTVIIIIIIKIITIKMNLYLDMTYLHSTVID